MEKLRRFVFVLAAVALFLATAMPSNATSANLADSAPLITVAAMEGMDCPGRDTSRNDMMGCMQATCIGFAVIADGVYVEASATRPAYAMAAVAWPKDFKSAPSTPPI